MTVIGNENTFEARDGFASVLDHLYKEIGRVEAIGKRHRANAIYRAGRLSYNIRKNLLGSHRAVKGH